MSASNQAAHSAPDARPSSGSQAVFRHHAMTTGFVAGTCLLLLLIALFWAQPSVNNIGASAILAVTLWFIWASGWWTKVVVSERGVYVDNVFFQNVIPWRVFADFSVDGGLVARLTDGTRVPVVSFGGSLAGAMTEYRGMTKKRDAMMAACREYRTIGKSAPGQYRRLIRPHWIALLAYVLPLVAIAVGIDAANHVF
jgi:Bacterial PH domain